MRPTVIPDWLEAMYEGCERRVIAPPDGDLTNDDIRAVEAITGPAQIGDDVWHAFRFAVVLEGDDLEQLQAGGIVVLTILGNRLQPFDIHVQPKPDGAT